MFTVKTLRTVILILIGSLLVPAQSIEAQATDDSTRINELERQIQAITQDLEELTLGTEVVNPAERGSFGLAPAAGKVQTFHYNTYKYSKSSYYKVSKHLQPSPNS